MNKKSGKIIFWVAAVVSCILAGFLAGYFLGEILPADAGIAQKVVALFLLFLNVAGVYFVQMGLVKAGDMLWQKMNSIKKMKTGRVQFVWQLGINIVVIIAFFLAAVWEEKFRLAIFRPVQRMILQQVSNFQRICCRQRR